MSTHAHPEGPHGRARPAPTPVNFGPGPWQQTQWDWRAAGNIGCGGAGGGLIVCAVLARAQGSALTWLLLGGLALVGVGLTCVWAEIGRPLRALHVFFNPRTSWMSREAVAATLLMPATLAAAIWVPGLAWPAAALALVFVYCQARMVNAARGIPAWREPRVVPLLVLTALAEGAGLLLLASPAAAAQRPLLVALAALLVVARAAAWSVYRRRLALTVTAAVASALDATGHKLLWGGSLLPLLALLAGAALGGSPWAATLTVLAGLLVVGAGGWLKFTLITRAGSNQGYALVHLPVRGVHR